VVYMFLYYIAIYFFAYSCFVVKAHGEVPAVAQDQVPDAAPGSDQDPVQDSAQDEEKAAADEPQQPGE